MCNFRNGAWGGDLLASYGLSRFPLQKKLNGSPGGKDQPRCMCGQASFLSPQKLLENTFRTGKVCNQYRPMTPLISVTK